MAKLSVDQASLVSVANSLRKKGKTAEPLEFPTGFVNAIDNIDTAEYQELAVTANGVYNAPKGIGYNKVDVNVKVPGEPSEDVLTLRGDCDFWTVSGINRWFYANYKNKMRTQNIESMSYMFDGLLKGDVPPFVLNLKDCWAGSGFANWNSEGLPPIKGSVRSISGLFLGAHYIKYHSIKDYFKDIDFSQMDGPDEPNNLQHLTTRMYQRCHRLEYLEMEPLKHGSRSIHCGRSNYYDAFEYDHLLNEIIDLPNPHYEAVWESNGFGEGGFVRDCHQLKDLTFAPFMTNGQPNRPHWKYQTIDMTQHVGYWLESEDPTKYGLPAGKEIVDNATYYSLKNDPEAWTKKVEFSKYNKASAKRTINSLPDISAHVSGNVSNTIKFTGASGLRTEDGAINTLTEQEIAIATAKGWTVTMA